MKVKTVRKTFRKMRQRGMITPPISVIDLATRSVKSIYHNNLEVLEKLLLDKLKEYNVPFEKKTVLTKDSLEELIRHISSLTLRDLSFWSKRKLKKEFSELIVSGISGESKYDQLRKRLKVQFNSSTKHFFKELLDDSDDRLLLQLLSSYRLDKNEVFKNRIKSLRDSYINNAIDRIAGEQDELKKSFLSQFTDWIEGKEDKLDIKDVLTQMKKTSVREARFFARDQFGKFNKALLIASFREAGVTHVKLVTCRDSAVRPKHREWNNKIYAIDSIPIEWWTDYNCRCSAVPFRYKQ